MKLCKYKGKTFEYKNTYKGYRFYRGLSDRNEYILLNDKNKVIREFRLKRKGGITNDNIRK